MKIMQRLFNTTNKAAASFPNIFTNGGFSLRYVVHTSQLPFSLCNYFSSTPLTRRTLLHLLWTKVIWSESRKANVAGFLMHTL